MKKNIQTQAIQVKQRNFLLFSMILFTITFFAFLNNLFGSPNAPYPAPYTYASPYPSTSPYPQATPPGVQNYQYPPAPIPDTYTQNYSYPPATASAAESAPQTPAPAAEMQNFHCDPIANDPQNIPGTSHLKCRIGGTATPAAAATVTPSAPAPAPAAAPPTPAPTAAPPTPAPTSGTVILFNDDTSTQYQGWNVHRKETVDMGAPYNLHGMIIGRLDPKEEASKTYILSSPMQEYFRLTFLFLKMGSPDNERAELSINNATIIGQNFWLYRDDPIVVDDQTFSIPLAPYANVPVVFNPQWHMQPWPGQVMAVTMVFKKNGNNMALIGRNGKPTPVSFPLNGNQLLFKFKSGLDEPISNEAFGLMNLKGETFNTFDPSIIIPKRPPAQ